MSKSLIKSLHSEDGKDVNFAAMVGTVISVQAFNESSVSGTSSRQRMEISTTHAVNFSALKDRASKKNSG